MNRRGEPAISREIRQHSSSVAPSGSRVRRGYYLFRPLAALIVQELNEIARLEGATRSPTARAGSGTTRSAWELHPRDRRPRGAAPLELGLEKPTDVRVPQGAWRPLREREQTLRNTEQNLWGTTSSSAATWIPEEYLKDTYVATPFAAAPNKPVIIEVGFVQGRPVSIDGEVMGPVELIGKLNHLGGRCAVGRFDVIENRITGVKTRELYEAPAAAILHAAHRALESITLERDVLHFKEPLSHKFADLVYEGKWFSPMREGLDAFFARVNERVTGTVRLSLFKGAISVTGRKSPNSLLASRNGSTAK
jgi:argininosuccinate synthase